MNEKCTDVMPVDEIARLFLLVRLRRHVKKVRPNAASKLAKRMLAMRIDLPRKPTPQIGMCLRLLALDFVLIRSELC